MSIKLLLDENVPPRVALELGGSHYDVIHIRDVGMRGCTDSEVKEFALKESRCIVTLDSDFADIRNYPPGSHAGIIVLKLKYASSENVTKVLLGLLPKLLDIAIEKGVLVSTNGDSYRLRLPENMD
jgi:predicted nuclease of predicted toxin-antitoxin system